MVYESDFYTTRRPYTRTTPSLSSYTVSKREIPWEKVPFVPRPSLVPDPVTAFGKRKTPNQKESPKAEKLIITPLNRARIRPVILSTPVKPYVSPREETRQKVQAMLRKEDLTPRELPSSDAMDIVLPRVHKKPLPQYTRRTPRHYVVRDSPDRSRRADEQYSYSYVSNVESSSAGGSGSRPSNRSYSTTESVKRSTGSGPGSNYSYSTERSSRSSDYPGSYHSSYSSTASGRLPGGTNYRHFSYRV